MTLIRRIVLALALMAGLSSAFAQSPNPVPALPDQERRTAYNIVASTCACAVNMALYGDGTDVDAWLQVWVNGTRYLSTDPTFGWSLSSISGTIGQIALPITDAKLTFNAVQTGTIQIVGARRPRRLSQFNENQGVAARDLNQALTDMVAQQRESWDKTNDLTGRGLFSQPGNTMGPLPRPTVCNNGFLNFGANGLTPQCIPLTQNNQGIPPQFQIFTTPGAVTTLTLTAAAALLPTASVYVTVYFDGSAQARDTWSINIATGVITFNSAVPVNVQQVEVDWFNPNAVIGSGGSTTITGMPTFVNISALRLNTATAASAYVAGYTTASDGGEGVLTYVASDTASADNGCTIFVDAMGHRWYRSVSTFISVKWCGAQGNQIADDTAPINNAIVVAKAYQAGLTSVGGVCVLIPTGTYIISTINATLWSSGCIEGPGGAAGATLYAQNSAGGPIIDTTSSPGLYMSHLLFYGTKTDGTCPATKPSVGFLELVGNTAGNDTDLIILDFVEFAGCFNTAACYLYAITDIHFRSTNCSNLNPSAGYGMVAGNTNIFGLTSSFAPTSVATGVLADITWDGGSGGINSNAQDGLLLQGCNSCRFRNGVISGTGPHILNITGQAAAVVFDEVQYENSGTPATALFFFQGATVRGFEINVPDIYNNPYTGTMLVNSGSTFAGAVVLGVDPSLITGTAAASFSHLP